MKKEAQLWVKYQNQSADNPQHPQDWTLVKTGNIESQYDLAELWLEARNLEKEGNQVMITRDLDIDLVVNG